MLDPVSADMREQANVPYEQFLSAFIQPHLSPGSPLSVFLAEFNPQPDEFLVGVIDPDPKSKHPGSCGVITSERLVFMDGVTPGYREVDLIDIFDARVSNPLLAGLGNPVHKLELIKENKETIEFPKLYQYPDLKRMQVAMDLAEIGPRDYYQPETYTPPAPEPEAAVPAAEANPAAPPAAPQPPTVTPPAPIAPAAPDKPKGNCLGLALTVIGALIAAGGGIFAGLYLVGISMDSSTVRSTRDAVIAFLVCPLPIILAGLAVGGIGVLMLRKKKPLPPAPPQALPGAGS